MKKIAIAAISTGAFALLFTTIAPQSADAGWRRKAARHGYYAPRVHVLPRNAYYAPRKCRRARYGCGSYPYAYYPYWRKRNFGGWY